MGSCVMAETFKTVIKKYSNGELNSGGNLANIEVASTKEWTDLISQETWDRLYREIFIPGPRSYSTVITRIGD